MALFRKSSRNPLIPRTRGTFYAVHSANPDIIRYQGRNLMLFRGQDERGHDEIGVAVSQGPAFRPFDWVLPDKPCIRVSENPAAFDSGHILDPAGLQLDERLFVYYTAHRADWDTWNIPSHIGLAVSKNGSDFEKHGQPIIEGMAPEAVLHEGKVHLVFQRLTSDDSLAFYVATSSDGIHFDQNTVTAILSPSGREGSFDERSISTARIWKEGHWFLMAYGGCRRFPDYPEGIGLARSKDLRHWERYPGNPILKRGQAGAWDEGALWFATGHRDGRTTYLYYEGVGRTPAVRGNRSLALLCRHHDYGGYAETAFSQVGVAATTQDLADW